ncbi:MAG: hypothetical protein A2268_05575 [Candidatus Raymondbacteria bacterium RifOxyA12_full_50_37]|uniref:Secretion system C-terminal sorting domain-containing protein n=1 Tax=Candidatus Raymondbacteria bacterium RIFOXYD12_FULL_49_13 TaxID=1817890 RepID=A0A1F7F558_UNCRA|nr:MAG: hypothetical protein A2268_05575 [Candidatus Raymondbacteria bacterium RifOxyA12_full_50_37]OGJ89034.1 MAG: hypothetical protein A2248_02810 [Candidatus Raymondbacteria bacterium RIFOXYA2_FULL_49_16]OGJ93797.1 MAG: hypothetical protein A2350_06550 [Candidatus Raymondbacteria bacterium RifOxyB12_full_50_8]OGJ97061.1 MAG: hypothetical protein A2453_04225 [Candidatus Raymondbacteria bacterium RIFOXYC2_FULL_50_21]OGK01771.1 MAG: hypothetical protein A2519_01670 [Candidatus Raymondbacteria b
MRPLFAILFKFIFYCASFGFVCPPVEYIEEWRARWDTASPDFRAYEVFQPNEDIVVDGILNEPSWVSVFNPLNKGVTWFDFCKWDITDPSNIIENGGTYNYTGTNDQQADVAMLWKTGRGLYIAAKRYDDSYYTIKACTAWENFWGYEGIEFCFDPCNLEKNPYNGGFVYKIMLNFCPEKFKACVFKVSGFIGGGPESCVESYPSGSRSIDNIAFAITAMDTSKKEFGLEVFVPFAFFNDAMRSGACPHAFNSGAVFGMGTITTDRDIRSSTLWQQGAYASTAESPDCRWHKDYYGFAETDHYHSTESYFYPSFKLMESPISTDDIRTDEPSPFSAIVQPNPFNPATTICYSGLKRNADISIYDVRGNVIKTLKANNSKALWNGADKAGNSVAGGIYMYTIDDNVKRMTGKMLFLK